MHLSLSVTMKASHFIYAAVVLISTANAFVSDTGAVLETNEKICNSLDPQLIKEIEGYQDVANKIIDLCVNGALKGETYRRVHDLVDRYPVRLSGFKNLEDSIDYVMKIMNDLEFENVRGEEVAVPRWYRGEESAWLLVPHVKSLKILGLGTSVATAKLGITAPVLVVKSFEELDKYGKEDKVKGKIVVYNQGWLGSYLATYEYRLYGASYASQYGAVAALIQSITDFSMNTPHTGVQIYWSNVTKIPAACITMEDAEYLYGLQKQGYLCRIHLKMLDYNLPNATSRNVFGEIVGKKTTEYVTVSGHIDSWDVGENALDDAGGAMISVMALAALKKLNLVPRRTLQTILWTSEELGLIGAFSFAEKHANILANYSVAIEADMGIFKPKGLDFAGNENAGCIVKQVLKLMTSINASSYRRYDHVLGTSDVEVMQEKGGVPVLGLNNENDRYFWYHHSDADTMSLVKSSDLDLSTALFAVTSYVLADISVKLPRDTNENH